MNSNTIREVLIKIIGINKGLNEETMNKLLVASGWENNDVQEGMRIFREINPNKNSIPNPEQIHTTIVTSQPVTVIPDPQPVVKQETIVEIPKVTQTPVQIANAIHLQQPALAVPSAEPVVTSLNSIKEKLAMHAEKIEPQKIATVEAPVIPVLKDIETLPEEKGNTPWGFVLFDIFLFLIALGLLIFIFIK